MKINSSTPTHFLSTSLVNFPGLPSYNRSGDYVQFSGASGEDDLAGITYTSKGEKISWSVSSNKPIISKGNQEKVGELIQEKLNSVVGELFRAKQIAKQSVQSKKIPLKERNQLAHKVEKILHNIVVEANARSEKGYLFSGRKTDSQPFQVIYEERDDGSMKAMRVEYQGDTFPGLDRDKVLNGNRIFWNGEHTILGTSSEGDYLAQIKQKIFIDGFVVRIIPGDNLDAVIRKINRDVITVNAFKWQLPGGKESLGIESRFPHQIALSDLDDGTVLSDLGIIKPGEKGRDPFTNLSETAMETRHSLFDTLIDLRDNIIDGKIKDIRQKSLPEISQSADEILNYMVKLARVSL